MSSVPKESPASAAAWQNAEPTIVAFRPMGAAPTDASATVDHDAAELPVLLRLPDLNAALAAPEPVTTSTDRRALVNRLTWIATGLLALVAVGLLATGKKAQAPAGNDEAPRWKGSAEAPPKASFTGSRPRPVANPIVAAPPQGSPQVINPRGAPNPVAEPLRFEADDPWAAGPPGWSAGPDGPVSRGSQPVAAPAGAYPASEPYSPDWNYPAEEQPRLDGPQLPDNARRQPPPERGPEYVAEQPRGAANGQLRARTAEARFEGGIRNLDVSPRYDGTRPSLH